MTKKLTLLFFAILFSFIFGFLLLLIIVLFIITKTIRASRKIQQQSTFLDQYGKPYRQPHTDQNYPFEPENEMQ